MFDTGYELTNTTWQIQYTLWSRKILVAAYKKRWHEIMIY